MAKLKQVWVWLSDEEIRDLDREGVVELKKPVPECVGIVWGFKEKPQDV